MDNSVIPIFWLALLSKVCLSLLLNKFLVILIFKGINNWLYSCTCHLLPFRTCFGGHLCWSKFLIRLKNGQRLIIKDCLFFRKCNKHHQHTFWLITRFEWGFYHFTVTFCLNYNITSSYFNIKCIFRKWCHDVA